MRFFCARCDANILRRVFSSTIIKLILSPLPMIRLPSLFFLWSHHQTYLLYDLWPSMIYGPLLKYLSRLEESIVTFISLPKRRVPWRSFVMIFVQVWASFRKDSRGESFHYGNHCSNSVMRWRKRTTASRDFQSGSNFVALQWFWSMSSELSYLFDNLAS